MPHYHWNLPTTILGFGVRGILHCTSSQCQRWKDKPTYRPYNLWRGRRRGSWTFMATIASLDEDNGAKEALPPCIRKDLEKTRMLCQKSCRDTYSKMWGRPQDRVGFWSQATCIPFILHSSTQIRGAKEVVEGIAQRRSYSPVQSTYGAPILFQKKEDRSVRLCIDYWALNKVMVKNKYPIPLIADLFDRLGQDKYFTKVDLRKRYYQVFIK